MLNKKLIVAHYRETLDWLDNLHGTISIQVYDKGLQGCGGPRAVSGKINYTTLPNVGREPHTYFHYIVENYDSLPDVAIFSQGDPHAHISNWNDIVNGSTVLWNDISKQIIGKSCWFFYCPPLLCDKQGNSESPAHHPGLDIEAAWDMLFDSPCPDTIEFTPTCHFSVTRDHIQHRPISFYKKLVNMLGTHAPAGVLELPWIVERLMPYIFNKDYGIKED